jgi:hypothetical protein
LRRRPRLSCPGTQRHHEHRVQSFLEPRSSNFPSYLEFGFESHKKIACDIADRQCRYINISITIRVIRFSCIIRIIICTQVDHCDQGRQIFLGPNIPEREKYTKWLQNIPSGHYLYQMAVKISK